MQAGDTVKVYVSNLTVGRNITASGLTVSTTAGLSRVVNETTGTQADVEFRNPGGSNYIGITPTGQFFYDARGAVANHSWEHVGGEVMRLTGSIAALGVTGSICAGGIVPAARLDVRGDALIEDDVTVTNGNYIVGTAGKGLQFPSGLIWRTGTGTPESAVTAPVGSLFTRTDGGSNTTLYVKESGAGNTGWVAK